MPPYVISEQQHAHDPQPSGAPFSVKDIQRRLIARGFDVGRTGADGVFGDATDHGVRVFQKREGLVVDGDVGPDTWRLLARSTSKPSAAAKPGSAAAFADMHFRWLCVDGYDGTRPGYHFGEENNLASPRWPNRTDCSESVQRCVYQQVHDSWVDGSRNQYLACRHISVEQAIMTKGALLFISGSGSPTGIHHVAVSMGNGKTSEARSAHMSPQCGSWNAHGRFQYAGLIPVLRY